MSDLYKGQDPRALPAYPISEAAHDLGVPQATLRSWVVGRRYPRAAGAAFFEPLISIADPDKRLLSFTNLVEVHVLSSLRQQHGVRLGSIRSAIDYVCERSSDAHPLATVRFKTDGIDLFIDELGRLINASQQGQMAIREVMEAHLERVEHDEHGLAIKLYPLTRTGATAGQPKVVVIDPRIAFGRPSVVGTGVPTEILADRWRVGESIADLADDYRLEPQLIEEAVRWAA